MAAAKVPTAATTEAGVKQGAVMGVGPGTGGRLLANAKAASATGAAVPPGRDSDLGTKPLPPARSMRAWPVGCTDYWASMAFSRVASLGSWPTSASRGTRRSPGGFVGEDRFEDGQGLVELPAGGQGHGLPEGHLADAGASFDAAS